MPSYCRCGQTDEELDKEDGAGTTLHTYYIHHLQSFREQISLSVPPHKKEHVTLIDTLDRRQKEHEKRIFVEGEAGERNDESLRLIVSKVLKVITRIKPEAPHNCCCLADGFSGLAARPLLLRGCCWLGRRCLAAAGCSWLIPTAVD